MSDINIPLTKRNVATEEAWGDQGWRKKMPANGRIGSAERSAI